MSSLVENKESERESFRIGNISSMEEIMDNQPSIKQKFIAECLGTLLLVFIACGIGVYTEFQINPTTMAGGLVVTGLVYVFQ
jgi:glycerol uptake facilitator-like aquaporin